MTETAILQLISTTGAAAVLFWVVYQLIAGKLHTNSELDARDRIIEDYKKVNQTLTDQLRTTNEIFEKAIERGYAAARRSRSG